MSSPRGALRETATLIGADFAGWRGQSPSKPGVLYACTPTDHTCDALVSGYDLYISKSCSQTRCSYCMIEEIDTHLCPHDLDNYPAHEAMKMQNRSNKSVECPACGTHLHVDNENSEWFFRCHWCWWDSRPLGLVGNMADDVIKELRRKERESDQEQEMERLVKQFSASAVEAAAAAADAQKQRRGLASAMGIFGSGAKLPQKSTDEITMEWETKQRALGYEGPREESICSPVKLPPAAGDMDQFPLDQISNLMQRHRQPDTQSPVIVNLLPRRTSLLTKRTKRCPVTKDPIVKPDISAAKATFQLKRTAFQFIPKITVGRAPKADMLLLRFTNPLDHAVSFEMTQWFRPGDEQTEKPYLFPVPSVSTTIGAKEDFLPDKPKELRDDDDQVRIHSRTTNSVVVRLIAAEAITSPVIQARLKVTVKIEEDDIDSLDFHVLINVPPEKCKP